MQCRFKEQVGLDSPFTPLPVIDLFPVHDKSAVPCGVKKASLLVFFVNQAATASRIKIPWFCL
jgi:hypothetical protein